MKNAKEKCRPGKYYFGLDRKFFDTDHTPEKKHLYEYVVVTPHGKEIGCTTALVAHGLAVRAAKEGMATTVFEKCGGGSVVEIARYEAKNPPQMPKAQMPKAPKPLEDGAVSFEAVPDSLARNRWVEAQQNRWADAKARPQVKVMVRASRLSP